MPVILTLLHWLYFNNLMRMFVKGTAPNAQRTAVIAAAELASYDSSKQYLLKKWFAEDSIWVHLMSVEICLLGYLTISGPYEIYYGDLILEN